MSKTYLITGASRGIGAEFVRQILAGEPDSIVIGAAREPASSDELRELGKEHGERLKTVKLDVIDLQGIREAAKEVERIAPGGIDVVCWPAPARRCQRSAGASLTKG